MAAAGSYISRMLAPAALPKSLESLEFWYSPRSAVAFLAALFLLVQSLSSLIPPFQSPDEIYHLKRAYLLSVGTVVLDKQHEISGGYIDTGLLEYMEHFKDDRWFPYNPDSPVFAEKPSLAKDIHWSGKVSFSDVPNVAVYFPLPYFPQALAFIAGRTTGLSVSESYHLARCLSLIAALIILYAACRLYPVPPLVAALFLMPMTLYQLGSASLDAVSFSTVALTGALYMRAASAKLPFTTGMHALLALCLFSLATTRINLVVLTLLPIALYTTRRSYAYLVSSGAAVALSLMWIAFVLATVRGGHGNPPEVTSRIVAYYLHHIGSFFGVTYSTLTNGTLVQFYWKMFIGIFGWSSINIFPGGVLRSWGVFLAPTAYTAFSIVLVALAALTFQPNHSPNSGRGSLWLIGITLLSAFLILPILLATWTPQPAIFIYGIQGRYFIPTVILLGFALFGKRLTMGGTRACCALLFLAAIISVMGMTPVLLTTWWVN